MLAWGLCLAFICVACLSLTPVGHVCRQDRLGCTLHNMLPGHHREAVSVAGLEICRSSLTQKVRSYRARGSEVSQKLCLLNWWPLKSTAVCGCAEHRATPLLIKTPTTRCQYPGMTFRIKMLHAIKSWWKRLLSVKPWPAFLCTQIENCNWKKTHKTVRTPQNQDQLTNDVMYTKRSILTSLQLDFKRLTKTLVIETCFYFEGLTSPLPHSYLL